MVSLVSAATNAATAVQRHELVLPSAALGRAVSVSILLPPGHKLAAAPYPVLYLNDGQDLDRLHLPATFEALLMQAAVRPFLIVAPHANEQRTQEYGVAAQADYNGRGSQAAAYTAFLLKELLPLAQQGFGASADPAEAVVAGFSLGGLAAFDVAFHHPDCFRRAGVFSGSFWWRSRAVGAGYTPLDRLMHAQVRAGGLHPQHQFWLQTGTLDERNDRNQNGVIDSLADCLDLVEELLRQGLDPKNNLRYVQVEGGHHNQETWGRLLPDFLRWAFGTAAGPPLPAPLPVVRLQLDPADPALAPVLFADAHPAPAGGPPPAFVLPVAPHLISSANPATTMLLAATRPAVGDYLPYTGAYISLVPDGADPLDLLRQQLAEVQQLFGPLTNAQALTAYAPGKWTPKQVLLHVADAERIFAYRALRFARHDGQALPGFDENEFAAHSAADARPLADLLAEYAAVRAATLALLAALTDEQLARRGAANGAEVTVRALAYIMAGHERHHLNVFRERYLPVLGL